MFRAAYALLRISDPLERWAWRNGQLGITAELTVPGRRSGRPRSVLAGLMRVGGHSYVGHPNGRSQWTRNLRAARRIVVRLPFGGGVLRAATLLERGAERSAVIEAAGRQQPWPANWLYSAARAHIEAVGDYYRLDPVGESGGKEG